MIGNTNTSKSYIDKTLLPIFDHFSPAFFCEVPLQGGAIFAGFKSLPVFWKFSHHTKWAMGTLLAAACKGAKSIPI